MNAVETILNHQSVRNFTGQSLTDEQVKTLSEVVARTSSSCFFQTVRVIRITDREKLERIAELSGDQEHIARCAELWMFCIDLTLLMQQNELKAPFPFRFFYSGMNDTSLTCQNVLTAAESMGLGGTIIGGFKPGIVEISKMLNLPFGVAPCLGLILGVPDVNYLEQQKPRLPLDYLIFENTYKDVVTKEGIDEYNATLRAYYENRKYNRRSIDWSSACSAMLGNTAAKPALNPLIEYFKGQGFSFD